MTVLGWDPLGLYLLEALEEYSSFKVVKGRLVVVDVLGVGLVVLVDVVESVVIGIELVAVIVVVKDGKVVVSSVKKKQKKAK